MRISQPKLTEVDNYIEYSVTVSDTRDLPPKLWFRVDAQHAEMLSSSSDAALLALLLPAMMEGKEIALCGAVDAELLHQVNHEYQPFIRTVIPELKTIIIAAEEKVDRTNRAAGVMAAFSGGIDSYALLADHYYNNDLPDRMRATHLLYTNVGSHGSGGRALFREKLQEIEALAIRIGLPLVAVDSNIEDFYLRANLHYQRTHTLRHASVAYLLQNGIGRFLYASGYPYAKIGVTESQALATTDPVALPILSSASLELRSAGSAYTRTKKTELVHQIPATFDSLDVCINNTGGMNCSKCWKCIRTQATLEMLGALEDYSESFDLNTYHRHRNAGLAPILFSRDAYAKEIRALGKTVNFKYPLAAYVTGPIVVWKNWTRKQIGTVLRAPKNAGRLARVKHMAAKLRGKSA